MAEQREPSREVESLEGFAAYLKHLVADLQGPEPQNPERDLKDFFWSWARAVGSGWLGGASAFAVAEGEPGWRALAFQIHDALTGHLTPGDTLYASVRPVLLALVDGPGRSRRCWPDPNS